MRAASENDRSSLRSLLAGVSLVRLVAALFALLIAVAPALAHAGDIEDFQVARAAYEARDWSRAVAYFEGLVGGDTPRLRNQPLVLESRKYLAAAYLFVGRREAARDQFERLLAEEPTYELDASQFPLEVVEVFDDVRRQMAADRERDLARVELERERDALRERARLLVEFASEDVTIEVENSRWLALVPYGVGQFQNGDEGWGWFFLSTESVLSLSGFVSLVVHTSVVDQISSADVLRRESVLAEANGILTATTIINWSSLGALAVVAITGVVQAELDFHPTRRYTQRRTVPPSLLEGIEVGVGSFRMRF